MPINGLVVMTPTSIASTGTGNSSSINADGSVDFASCATLSLNGVFTSSYDNYMVTMRYTAGADQVMNYRLRVSGSDASGINYTHQLLTASSTTILGQRDISQTYFRIANHSNTLRQGETIYLFGPALAQPTAQRSVSAWPYLSGSIFDVAATHSLSTAYDGLTMLPTGTTITGLITVFGFNQ